MTHYRLDCEIYFDVVAVIFLVCYTFSFKCKTNFMLFVMLKTRSRLLSYLQRRDFALYSVLNWDTPRRNAIHTISAPLNLKSDSFYWSILTDIPLKTFELLAHFRREFMFGSATKHAANEFNLTFGIILIVWTFQQEKNHSRCGQTKYPIPLYF